MFADWLQKELDKKGWSQNELAKRAGISRGAVNHVLNGSRQPGTDLCLGVARALKISPEIVFRKAELLPPASEEDPLLDRANYLLSQLPPEKQEEMIDYLEMLYDREQRKGENNHPRPRLAGSDG